MTLRPPQTKRLRQRHPSIFSRLMWSLTLTVAFTALVVIAINFKLEARRSETELRNRATEYAVNLSMALEIPVWSYDLDAIRGIVAAFSLNDDVAEIIITEPSGGPLAQFRRDAPGPLVLRTEEIIYNSQVVGEVSVYLTPQRFQDMIKRNFWGAFMLAALVTLAVFAAARFFLARFFRAPINELQQTLDAYAEGNYDAAIEPPATELQEFTRVLGNMGNRINRQFAELRQTRDALEKSEERLNLALEAANDGMWDWDVKTGEAFFSPRYFTMIGYEPGEFPSTFEAWKSLLHPEDVGPTEERIKRHFASGERFWTRFRMRTKSGGWRWIQGRGKVVDFGEDGRPRRMVGIHTDINDRVRAEEELQRMQVFLSNVIDSMPSTLAGVDPQGRVTHWNLGAEKATGISAREAFGRDIRDVFAHMPLAFMDKTIRAVETRTPLVQSRIPRQVDGETRFEDLAVYPLPADGAGGAVIRIDDVTERIRIDEMLIQSEKMLSVGGLAAGMAHEINNPLAGILGTVQVLNNRLFGEMEKNRQAARQSGAELESIREYMRLRGVDRMLAGVEESGNRAARIVSNMLKFSRKSNQRFDRNDLAGLLDETMELASSDYDLKRKYDFRQIQVIRNYEQDLPKVWCERGEIQQVFLNLLRNGAEAMSEKTYVHDRPTFTLRLARENGMVRIEIQDNGPGMDEKVRKRVFEPFFTSKGPGIGTGLGLSVSYFIISEQHDGFMEVRSTPSQGSRFIIRLPIDASLSGDATSPSA